MPEAAIGQTCGERRAASTTQAPPTCRARKRPTRSTKGRTVRRIRQSVQAAFLLLNVWIGVQFYLWVRQFETPAGWRGIERPPGVEGWLPIAALMKLKLLLQTGEIPSLHPAGLFLLLGFLAISLTARKAFCGWLCPVGTVSEFLWKQGRSIFGRNLVLPVWLDFPLRSLKYLLLGFFLWAILPMPVEAVRQFLSSPYALVADVKMLDFFRRMSVTTAIVLGVLAVASVFVRNFWCRYLCPYGALMGLAGLLSPLKICRNPHLCVECAKCSQACPSRLPVDQKLRILSAECTGCMECVSICPAPGALAMTAPGRRPLTAWAVAAVVGALFLGVVGYAMLSGHWETHLPPEVYQRLIPEARWFSHP